MGTELPTSTGNEQSTAMPNPMFLYIPTSRLIWMSILSFGLYEAYWIYKNWSYVKQQDGLQITPFWRGIFGVFFAHKLLARIHEDPALRAFAQPTFNHSALATGFVLLVILGNLISRAPGLVTTIIAGFVPSWACLLPVQKYVNSAMEKTEGAKYYGFSGGHVLCAVIGAFVWIATLVAIAAS